VRLHPAQLSGGEAQQVAIARALANRPRIVLADEPTAALDSERVGIVMDLLRKLAAEQQATIIAVTHDEKIFGRLDRIFRLREDGWKTMMIRRGHSVWRVRSQWHLLYPAPERLIRDARIEWPNVIICSGQERLHQ
jgi:energy-coupling factor transporter ATP-binding protein EcfA2